MFVQLYNVPELCQKATPLLGRKIVPAHSSRFKAELGGATYCLCIPVHSYLSGLVHWNAPKGILVSELNSKVSILECLVDLWVINMLSF